MNRPNLERLQQLARRDDWHLALVGSDVREVIAYALGLESRTQAETDVLAERAKQRAKWSNDHDDEYDEEELVAVAAWLADEGATLDAPTDWSEHIMEKWRNDRRKRLVIAAALLLAEIERLDRAGSK